MIRAYCVDPLTIQRWDSYDVNNEPTYSLIDVMGYIDWKANWFKNLSGETVYSAAKIYLNEDIEESGFLARELMMNDRIMIGSVDYQIIDISKPKPFSVEMHYEVRIA